MIKFYILHALRRTLRSLLALGFAFGVGDSLLAATLTWDADAVPSGAQEGAGAWDVGGAVFWNGSANVAAANNLTTDVARFGNGGILAEPAMVTVASASISGLLFGATLTSGYTLSNDSESILTIGGGGIVVNAGAQATILGDANLSIALGANQTWTNSGTNSLTVDGVLNGATRVLTLSGAGPIAFSGGFSNLGVNSTFSSGTNVTISGNSTINTALFANGSTTISAGTTDSLNQIVVINNTGHLRVTNTGVLTGVQLRIGSTSGQAANVTVQDGGQLTASGSIEFSHAGGTVASNLNLNPGGTFTAPVGFSMTGVGAINFNGGALKITSTLADLKVGGSAVLTLNVDEEGTIDVAAGVTVGVSQILAHAGTASTDGGVIKTGSGTLELKATNTYTGDTDVEGGTLILANASLNNFSTVRIAAGAVLRLNHSLTDAVAGLVLGGVVKADGVYNASNSGGFITGTGNILVDSTPAADDPLTLAFAALRNHINGVTTLTAAQLNTQATTIRNNAAKLGTNSAIIADALSLVTTYETKKGALFVVAPTRGGYLRADAGYELPNAMLTLEQRILDNTYTASCLAANESLLRGWKIGSSAHFPGSVAPPSDPTASRTVPINASQPKLYGSPVMYYDYDARRPTGSYLAPGSIGIVTVPAALVNKGFKVRVGAHSWDLSAKTRIERIDRISRVYNITSTTTKIAHPMGGGIYIEVPYLANAGLVNVQITNAVRSPFFSSTSFHQTTLTEWQDVERTQPGPWADFESDRFMMQVPRSWIYAYENPVALMANWDKAMDAVSDLMGRQLVRPKTVMYAQVDVILRADVNAPGYPMVNDSYEPYNATDGNKVHYLLTGPQNSPWATLHELGHGHSFTKFTGEVESAVNLNYVAVMNRKFGLSLDAAFGASIGAPSDMSTVTLKTVSLMWTLKNVFRTGNKTMLSADMGYEHKGHAKYVEIANLFGWDALGDFWRSVQVDFENGIDYVENSDPTDSRIVRMSKAAKADLRPLFHFWGAPPLNATNVRNAINAAALPPSGAIYRRLKFYQTAVPASQSAYDNFYYAIDQTGADTEIKAMFTNKTYTTAIATSAKAAIQGLLDLYFPNGDPDLLTPASSSWDVAPGSVGAGDGIITSGAGTWNTTSGNWTNDGGANNVVWINNSNATFGSGAYTVTLASGVTVRNLTVAPGSGNLTFRATADNGTWTLVSNPIWDIGDNTVNVSGDSIVDTKLTMASGNTLTVTGSGTFNTGEKSAGADWSVAGSSLSAEGTVTLRGNSLGVGKFSSVALAAGASYIHEKNAPETYSNAWNLSSSGQVVFNTRYPVTPTYTGVISGAGGATFNGVAVLSGANSYAGTTLVSTGTLSLTGNRVAAAGPISVGNVSNSTAALNFSNGTYTVGTFTVGSGNATAAGVVNQTGGSLTLSDTQLIVGNVGSGTTVGTAAFGTYNLSGGTLTGAPSTSRGVILGTNNGTTGTFNLTATGKLVLDSAVLMVGRSDSPVTGSSGYFNQSGGTAEIGTLTIAGGAGSGNIGHVNLTGGTFLAYTFSSLANAPNATASLSIGGSAQVTLPPFPITRGSGSTATLFFNGGTLTPSAASTAYLGGLTNAFVKAGGATFDVPSGRNITVSQILRVEPSSPGGGLTKLGLGLLTLSASNTYNGPTNVNAGTLSISQPFLANTSDVTLSNGGVLALNFNGSDTVDEFYIDGTRQAAGTWGSATSAATNKTSRLTGAGLLSVTTGPTVQTPFQGWAVASGLDGTPGKEAGFAADPDRDGLANGLEWILGGNPLDGSTVPPQISGTSTHVLFTFPRNDSSEAGTTLLVQWAAVPGVWSDIPVGASSSGPDSHGIVVTISENASASDGVVVAIPRSLLPSGTFFVRLLVSAP